MSSFVQRCSIAITVLCLTGSQILGSIVTAEDISSPSCLTCFSSSPWLQSYLDFANHVINSLIPITQQKNRYDDPFVQKVADNIAQSRTKDTQTNFIGSLGTTLYNQWKGQIRQFGGEFVAMIKLLGGSQWLMRDEIKLQILDDRINSKWNQLIQDLTFQQSLNAADVDAIVTWRVGSGNSQIFSTFSLKKTTTYGDILEMLRDLTLQYKNFLVLNKALSDKAASQKSFVVGFNTGYITALQNNYTCVRSLVRCSSNSTIIKQWIKSVTKSATSDLTSAWKSIKTSIQRLIDALKWKDTPRWQSIQLKDRIQAKISGTEKLVSDLRDIQDINSSAKRALIEQSSPPTITWCTQDITQAACRSIINSINQVIAQYDTSTTIDIATDPTTITVLFPQLSQIVYDVITLTDQTTTHFKTSCQLQCSNTPGRCE